MQVNQMNTDEEKVLPFFIQAHCPIHTVPENLFGIHFTTLDKVSTKAETTSIGEENNTSRKGTG